MFSRLDLFLVELAADDGAVVHREEHEFPVDSSFICIYTTQVVGQLEADGALFAPLGGLYWFDSRRLGIGRNGVSAQLADVSVYPSVSVCAANPCAPFSFPLYDAVLFLSAIVSRKIRKDSLAF